MLVSTRDLIDVREKSVSCTGLRSASWEVRSDADGRRWTPPSPPSEQRRPRSKCRAYDRAVVDAPAPRWTRLYA